MSEVCKAYTPVCNVPDSVDENCQYIVAYLNNACFYFYDAFDDINKAYDCLREKRTKCRFPLCVLNYEERLQGDVFQTLNIFANMYKLK